MSRVEQIRKEILLQLYACRPLALTAERMERDARKQGYDFTKSEFGRELQYLIDEELVIEVAAKGTTQKLYRISPNGIRQYEQSFSV